VIPELQVVIINAVALGVAYLGIYPALREKTLHRVLVADAVVTLVALGTAGALFFGSGTAFAWVFNWFWFSLITFMIMEWPLFLRFCRQHGIDPFSW
jgi:hypothetical protein